MFVQSFAIFAIYSCRNFEVFLSNIRNLPYNFNHEGVEKTFSDLKNPFGWANPSTIYCCKMALRIVISVSKLNYGGLVSNYLLKEPHSFGESIGRFQEIYILHTSATSVRNFNFKADHYVPLIKKEKGGTVIDLTGDVNERNLYFSDPQAPVSSLHIPNKKEVPDQNNLDRQFEKLVLNILSV